MAKYIDGYVLPVKKDKVEGYKNMAEKAGNVWKKHGALNYFECVGDDLDSCNDWGLPFPQLMKLEDDEVAFFSFITYESKEARDRINKLVMEDSEMKEFCSSDPELFDMKKMSMGGFEVLVER
jgi:alkaline phosphatase